MTEMVYGGVPVRDVEPILPKWWRTVDKITLTCVLGLMGIGMLLGLAASPPLAEKNGFPYFHYVLRQGIFVGGAMVTMVIVSMLSPREISMASVRQPSECCRVRLLSDKLVLFSLR